MLEHSDLSLVDLFETTDRRMTDLQTNLLANQECCLAESWAKLFVEMTEVRLVVTGLHVSLEFSQAELEGIKEIVKKSSLSTCLAVEHLKTVEEGLSNLDKQVIHIENQTRCNNVWIDGMQESRGEWWVQTEQMSQFL